MVTPGRASIVIIPFPFSDLSATKLRPAVVLADTSQGDWLLCQITSNPYGDPQAIKITKSDLTKGALNSVSFVRPMKLFTANETLTWINQKLCPQINADWRRFKEIPVNPQNLRSIFLLTVQEVDS